MSDEKVVSLHSFKTQRAHEAGHPEAEEGAFFFVEFADDELPKGVCCLEGPSPIGILLDKDNLSGICMTLEVAEKIANDLLAACKSVREGETDVRG